MSHIRTMRRPEQKRKFFTRPMVSEPNKQAQLQAPICAFCSMKSRSRCEVPDCSLPVCDKHRTRKAGGSLCPKHQKALLVQFDGLPTDRFGDRGEAYAQKIKLRNLTQLKPSV